MRDAAIGALDGGVLPDPVIDAIFAEQLAASIALEGLSHNLTTDQAVEIIESEADEPLLVVAGGVHIC